MLRIFIFILSFESLVMGNKFTFTFIMGMDTIQINLVHTIFLYSSSELR